MPAPQTTTHTTPPRPRYRPGSDARFRQRIGDITLSPDTVATPSGLSSTKQVEWQIDDGSTPAHASEADPGGVPGVVGTVRVTATGPGWKHVTAVPVSTLDEVTAIYAKVLHARRLAYQR
ncbi:hypothetical protein [Phycicoccus sp. Soil803]|uniref:hypothetical protein n=1 Tax=Phycicoccus sp. Soil803 TaxID=1736415 RepID=UPI00070FFF4E|nr:hypothetical protein [Phycicoccus sp. Soil803]KRF26267.1 hypothetical protein ASG95_18770 [Phycicoccus sp. Soil803]